MQNTPLLVICCTPFSLAGRMLFLVRAFPSTSYDLREINSSLQISLTKTALFDLIGPAHHALCLRWLCTRATPQHMSAGTVQPRSTAGISLAQAVRGTPLCLETQRKVDLRLPSMLPLGHRILGTRWRGSIRLACLLGVLSSSLRLEWHMENNIISVISCYGASCSK